MAKKFALVLGLHNLFNIVDSVYDVSSVKAIVSSDIDQETVAYIIATSDDGPVENIYKKVRIGNNSDPTPINTGDSFIWTHGKIYSASTVFGTQPISWIVSGDNWIDSTFTSNDDGSVTVSILHQNTATGTAITSSGTAETNGTASSGGVDVITGFKLDTNGHVTDVTRTKIYATPVTLDQTYTAGDGKYLSNVSLSGQQLSFTQKNNGVFSDGTGTTAGKLVVTTTTNNKVDDSAYSVQQQGSGTSTVTSSDETVPTTKAVLQAIQNAVVPTMTFKGTTSTLPSNPEEGDQWKIVPVSGQTTISLEIPANKSADGQAHTAKSGDTIIADDNGKWWLIPSGDDVEDTWRAIKVNGTAWKGGQLNTGDLNFKNGTAITVSGSNDDLTITHNNITRTDTTGAATTISDGGTFTVVTSTSSNNLGHVTGVEKTTFTIPTAGNGLLIVGADNGTDEVLFTANQTTGTNSSLDVSGGDVLTSTVSKSNGVVNITLDHDQLTAAQKTAVAPADPTTLTGIDKPNGATVVITGVTVNDYGHVTAISKKKITSDQVNNATLTVDGNNLNKTVVIYADNVSRPTSGGSAATFTANDDTAASYHVFYTGASDGVDWATIGYPQS